MPWGRRDRGGEGVSRSANETLTGSPSARPAHSAAVGSGRWALARVSTPLRLRVSTHRRRGGLPVRTAHSPLAAPLLAAGVRGLHWARGSCSKEQAGQWARGTAGDRDSHARGAFGGSEVPGRPLEGGVPLSPLTPRTPCLASAHAAAHPPAVGAAAAAAGRARRWRASQPGARTRLTGLNTPWVQAVKRALRRKRLSPRRPGVGTMLHGAAGLLVLKKIRCVWMGRSGCGASEGHRGNQ